MNDCFKCKECDRCPNCDNCVNCTALEVDKLMETIDEMKAYIKELEDRNVALVKEIKMWQGEVNSLESLVGKRCCNG